MARKKLLIDKIYSLNWSLIALVSAISTIGFAMLYSAAEGSFSPWAGKQMIRFALMFPIMIMIAVVDIRFWFKSSYIIYAAVLVMLVITEFAGVTAMGATRWIRIGPLNIQPSEIMKVCVIFALANYFHRISPANLSKITYIIPPILMVVVPAILVLRQPDLGTALIVLATGGMVFFAAGVRIWKFVTVGIAGVLSLPVVWIYMMHDYQKKRVISFLDPESDPLGDGYNILQSKIAIGSGGLSGKGFLKGTQSQLSFLPEKQTDFIFTMLTEEFGFVGGIILLALYSVVIMYGLIIAVNCRNHFGRLLAFGVVSVFFLHIFVNIAMVMGLIPIVGAPLPLLSYGGTIMMTMMIAFGLLLNVHLYNDEVFDK